VHIDKRFEQVDKRFEQVDKRFEQIDKRFEQVDARFVKIEASLSAMQKMFYDLMIQQTRWIISMMLVLVGATFTAARFIH
jgi:chaperonin cofactor prefoldin